ncbi:hypothetical protein GCM10027416_05930 [Okibacterium endophyticum]
MLDELIPASVKTAAKRGFIRTTSQAYATALAGGISASVIIATLQGGADWAAIGITVGVTVVSPLLAGAASFLSIISKGVPEEYLDADSDTL